ncbi:2-amino-4-hydroxy-6-hydroxymethyldihydropteridine diphosphokinase [Halalkalibacter akibai]|uniref:2-amino-4-hydroxy-6- hydroxymethyldihydropteridine diphosphokinase n=1 Tax=Halalkalibacter akibai TaxID=1411 RepID=UPI00068A0BF7|nr:2-amino-4-hydroxy-6-hydroxymethyldihydropteridine diphosphokinase [Halalkalibacter akibai]
MRHNVYIALGSNVGERYSHLITAIELIEEHEHIKLVKRSSIYETEPIGYVDQQSFLNMVIHIQTDLHARELLDVTQKIEQQCGRKRDVRWGPRTLDLDILLFDQEYMLMEDLSIPHPRMWERAFVIIPLMELHPTLRATHLNKSIHEIAEGLVDKEGVRRWIEPTEKEYEPIVSSKDTHSKSLPKK